MESRLIYKLLNVRRLILVFCLLLLNTESRADNFLFKENAWQTVLVISDNPEINEWYAAQSLSSWAQIVTGVKIDVVAESAVQQSKPWKIFIGKTLASTQAQINPPAERGDTAIRQIKGNSIFLLGNNPGATRIAVGRFCEQALGITFCQPGAKGADYTTLKEVTLPKDDLFKPAFYWRSVSGLSNEVSKDWAYCVGYGDSPAFSHSLYKIFNDEVWQKNPSLFAKNGGGYVKPNGLGSDPNPNLAHPQAADIAKQYAIHWFKENPEATCVPIGINDSVIYDSNAQSEGWFRDRPVRTNYLISFLNKVAEGNWLNTHPDSQPRKLIGTLAYLDTLKAPSIKVDRDIFPWVCVDRMGYANEDFAQQDIDNCTAWVKSGADNVGAYDYWYGNNYCIPRVNFSTQARSIKSLHQAGVTGWYAELYPVWAFDAAKAWVGAKLLENPTADEQDLLNQWFNCSYGPAEKPMREVFKVIENEWSRTAKAQGKNQWLYAAFEKSATRILSDQAIDEIQKGLVGAENALGGKRKPSEREKNYLWRFNQFKEAWNLVVDFREGERLQNIQPTTPEEAMLALENLVDFEQLYEEEQTGFNFKWGTTSQKIYWSRLTSTNPREKWINSVGLNPQLDQRLMNCMQRDTLGMSSYYWLWENKKSESKILNTTTNPESLTKHWIIETVPRINSEKLSQPSLMALKNQSGVLHHTENIGPKKLVKFSISHNPCGGKIKLLVTFKGDDRSLTRTQQISEARESMIVLSPAWTEQIEFSVQFENAIDLQALEISQVSL